MIGPFLIAFEITFEQVRKKEELQNRKHDEEFNQDNPPEFPSPGHIPKALQIETEYFFKHAIKDRQPKAETERD